VAWPYRSARNGAHEGLRRAVAEILAGASWQRSRVHFMRNLLQRVPKHAHAMVAALVRTIFAQPDHDAAQRQLEQVCAMLQRRLPQAVALLQAAADEVDLHAVPVGALAADPPHEPRGAG
jgi:transposase-like protein